MILESNYDNRLANVGIGAKAGAANGKIVIWKYNSKLKKIGKSKRRATLVDRYLFFGAKGGSKSSQMASKMEPISGKKQSKN